MRSRPMRPRPAGRVDDLALAIGQPAPAADDGATAEARLVAGRVPGQAAEERGFARRFEVDEDDRGGSIVQYAHSAPEQERSTRSQTQS